MLGTFPTWHLAGARPIVTLAARAGTCLRRAAERAKTGDWHPFFVCLVALGIEMPAPAATRDTLLLECHPMVDTRQPSSCAGPVT